MSNVRPDPLGLPDGDTTTRVADIAAMKPGQTLSDASFHEIKTVEKRNSKSKAKSIFRKLNRFGNVAEIVGKISRGASILNQLKKDIALNANGALIQKTGEPVDSITMNWSIYQYDGGKMKQAGPSFPVINGNTDVVNSLKDNFIQ